MTVNLIDTTFSGKNLSSAVSVYEYTFPAGVTTLRIQVRLGAVDGGGDYTANLRLNDGDAQTDDVIAPKTTYPAAVGETAFWFASMSIDGLAGDVVNVMVKGLAGDTNESGSIRIFADNYSTHSVADIWAAATRTLSAFSFTVNANLLQILGSNLTETVAGYLAAGLKKLLDVAIPVFTLASVNQTSDKPTAAQVDTQLSASHGAGIWGGCGGTGAIDWSNSFIVTVSGVPRDGVYCRFTTDIAGLHTVASGTTNTFGKLSTLMLDAGTYYVWLQLADVDFSPLPKVEVVS